MCNRAAVHAFEEALKSLATGFSTYQLGGIQQCDSDEHRREVAFTCEEQYQGLCHVDNHRTATGALATSI